jgi:anaerobic magnesium-protoporphyrin IX monomethyl ester cyclase
VVGGPQATFLPSNSLHELDPIDFICRSEGEVTLLSLVHSIEKNIPLMNVDGVTGRYPEGEGVWEGARVGGREDLDEYPSPYLDGTLDPIAGKEAILLASRGCPFKCIFCYTPRAFGNKIRYHSVERVVEEIAWLSRQGMEHFWFADPSFTFDQRRIHALLDSLLEKGISARIWLETRADLVNRELVKKMKRAGVRTIAYGLESASNEVLKRIQKPILVEQIEEAIHQTQEAGIEVELFSQYGLPGQTFEDALKTLEFVKKNNVKVQGSTNAQQMQIYYGTEVCEHYQHYGIHPLEEPAISYLSIGGLYETEWLSREEIQRLHILWKQSSLDGGKKIVS